MIAAGSSAVLFSVIPQPSGCTWEAVVDAVLYEDGSFEGDDSGVRGFVARRDGLIASLTKWLGVLNQASFAPDGLATNADREADEDQEEAFAAGFPKSPVLYGYWMARQH